ncbi:MAG: hypothetical protein JSV66_01290 [Trueperaceae bacterium]|nr:MAG: hypothetical protein JSV66_01290 [Trueperaceae bacterium]
MTPRRIAVIGTSGAGKTTLAAGISERLGIAHVELDALHWLENWTPNPTFRETVAAALSEPTWVVDGNYSRVSELTLGQADTAVWLDYRLPRLLWRTHNRIWRRALMREVLYNGNRERLWEHLFTRESLYWWVLTTYRSRRRRFAALETRFPHLQVVRLRTPVETAVWLKSLPHEVTAVNR